MISLIVLPVILLITVLYFLNMKHGNISKMQEDFETCKKKTLCPCEFKMNSNGEEEYIDCNTLSKGESHCDEPIYDYDQITNIKSSQKINYKNPFLKEYQEMKDTCLNNTYNPSEPKTSRSCQVYFTDDPDSCDNAKANDPYNTCKFTFPSEWFELDTISESSSATPMKINKKVFTKDGNNATLGNFANYELETKCFKESTGPNNDERTEFEFNINDIIRKDCSGQYIENNSKANNFAVDNKKAKNYASIKFDVYDGKNKRNNIDIYNNVIKSACSIEYPKLTDLANANLRFYKFSLDNSDMIKSIEMVKLNQDQTKFENEEFSVKSITSSSSSFGLA